MRILHVNKFLYRRGGAEGYMEDVAVLQGAAGHEVEFFAMQHPQNRPARYASHFPQHVEMEPPPPSVAGRVRGAGRILWSTSAARGIETVLDDFKPDIVHLHNIYHQLSPSILRPLARRNIPSVMTLHDYKLVCPTYQLLDHGRLCEACLGARFRHAVLRRCKDDSLASSALLALEMRVHTTLRAYSPVHRFVCPSRFLARKMAEGGVFPERMRVVNHFVDVAGVPVKKAPGGPIVFAGRLSPEKGVDVLVEAMARVNGAVLDIAGDGLERPALEDLAAGVAPGRVRFHGRLEKGALDALIRSASVVVMPSRWYENQPMIVLEAYGCGVPVVGTTLGGTPELIEDGVTGALVPPNDPEALAKALIAFVEDPRRALAMGAAGRARVESEFTPELHLRRIDKVYSEAIDEVSRRRRGTWASASQ